MEQPDRESKTEEATETRIREALEKGNVPHSREVATFASIAASLIAIHYLIPQRTLPFAQELASFIDRADQIRIGTADDFRNLYVVALLEIGRYVWPIIAVMTGLGLAAALAQSPVRILTDRIEPQLSRISLAAGWRRTFGAPGLIEFTKAFAKLVGIGALLLVGLYLARNNLQRMMFSGPEVLAAQFMELTVKLVWIVATTSALILAGDILWSRLHWRQELRMSRQEVKDEYKQNEGDPFVKARIRAIALSRFRTRMMAAVPRATLVIANPTHYAIALRYVPSEGGAPLVIAKGQDHIALRIRAIAEESGIPVIEDKPLARAMYDSVAVDQIIPATFYRAVAEIIHYLQTRGRPPERERFQA